MDKEEYKIARCCNWIMQNFDIIGDDSEKIAIGWLYEKQKYSGLQTGEGLIIKALRRLGIKHCNRGNRRYYFLKFHGKNMDMKYWKCFHLVDIKIPD